MTDQRARAQSADAVQFSVRHFTTEAFAERDRLAMWREEFGRAIVRVEMEPLSDEPLRAKATLRVLPGLRTGLFSGSAMRLTRTRANIAAGEDGVGFVVNLGRPALVIQRGRDLPLAHGDAYPILTAEPGILSSHRHFGMLFPREALASRVRNFEDTTRVESGTIALRLLVNYVNGLPDRLDAASPKLQDLIIAHLYDLAASAIHPDSPPDENRLSATAAARLELALDTIARHFETPTLTVSDVAADQHVSPRYLQRLIETTGSTFSERLTELRLQRAFSLLTDPSHRKARISDIALRAGFSDVSHFNRSFRRRFGDTPTQVRAASEISSGTG